MPFLWSSSASSASHAWSAVVLGAALASSSSPLCSGLDNGFTAPPMGWSALYGAPFGRVNETNVQIAAEGLNKGGFKPFGYKYVNLDDWYATRDPVSGKIMGAKANFPSGMRATADVIHDQGLLFGVYSAASQRTCGNYSASLFREMDDATTFANDWQIDMLKYDACTYNNGVASRSRYLAMSRALNATGRHIFYSVEGWEGSSQTQGDWGPEYANMWRTGNDIWPRWDHCILNNLYTTNAVAQYMVPGKAWNDPDMIQPPGYIPGRTYNPGLTFEEARSQFVLWSVMKAPLLLGLHYSTLATLSTEFPEYFDVITNEEIIAIDQDPSSPAVLVAQMPSQQQQQPSSSAVQVTFQQCVASQPSQKWMQPADSNVIQLMNSSLCVTAGPEGSANATACDKSNVNQQFSLKPTSTFAVGSFAKNPAACLASVPNTPSQGLVQARCTLPGDQLPPPLSDTSSNAEIFIWDTMTNQILSANSGLCLTAGLPNLPDTGKYVTNNGTLHHEVWRGPMTSGKEVLVLFNKGDSNETITASWDMLGCPAGKPCPVRDVIARQDLQPVAEGGTLSATVASHGVQAFLLG